MTLARQGPLTVGTLADHLGTDPSTIPRLLRPLVAQGFVTVQVGEDRRARLVDITVGGTRQLTMALRHWDQVQDEILTSVGDARWKAIRGDLQALRQATASPPRNR
jgi:DNA-binding MarR family transcriptional regulator